MIYELHSSDGKKIVIPKENRTRKTTEIEHSNGDRIVIEGDTMKLYKPNGSEFTFQLPKPPQLSSKPTV